MSPTDRPPCRPVMAQKMLQQSREAESALADALTFDSIDSYTRTPKGKGDHSDDSETSSICSERSHDSFRRPSDVSIVLRLEPFVAFQTRYSRNFQIKLTFYFYIIIFSKYVS